MYKSKAKFNAYMRQYKADLREEDINKAREMDRTNRRKWVRKNPEEAKAYMKDYYKKWLNEGHNRKIHIFRTRVACLKHQLNKFPGCKLKETNKLLLENLLKIGWRKDQPPSKVVNHIISVKILVEFTQGKISMTEVFNWRNLEVCSKEINSRSIKRQVNKKMIKVAAALEKEFPVTLNGLESHLKTLEGQVI